MRTSPFVELDNREGEVFRVFTGKGEDIKIFFVESAGEDGLADVY
jgi:hypothetical protein